MWRCTLCGRRGLLLFLNRNRLCRVCAMGIAYERQRLLRILRDPEDLAQTSGDSNTRLSECDLILERARVLLRYEKKGIRAVTPSPSEIVEKYGNVRRQIVLCGLKEDVGVLLEKARLATISPLQNPVAIADEALLRLCQARKEGGESPQLDDLEKQVTQFICRCQRDACLRAARKAESKGEKKKALEQYLSALQFFRKDEMEDSLLRETISEISSKITKLRD